MVLTEGTKVTYTRLVRKSRAMACLTINMGLWVERLDKILEADYHVTHNRHKNTFVVRWRLKLKWRSAITFGSLSPTTTVCVLGTQQLQ